MATTRDREDVRRIGFVYKEITAEEVTLLIREWFENYGDIPRIIDWDPNLARRKGQDEVADRFVDDACWPPAYIVRRLFGTWSKAIIEAGFYPRTRTKAWDEVPVARRSFYLRDAIGALKEMRGGLR